MFDGYKDVHDLPTAEDIGVFIPQSEIEAWWKKLQKKFPKIYSNEVSHSPMDPALLEKSEHLHGISYSSTPALSAAASSWNKAHVLRE